MQPYTEQGRIGIEREVAKNLSLSVTYLYYHGLHLTRTRDINLFAPAPFARVGPDGVTYTFQRFASTTVRPISRATGLSYNRINIFESASHSLYNGLAIQATQRLTHGFQFIAAYTYSKAKDDRPDQTAVVVGADDAKIVENQINPSTDYGRSDTDLRHRFVFSPVYEMGTIKWSDNAVAKALFSDYTFSTIMQFQSGSPYSALVGGDPNNDGNRSNDRLPGTVRNQFTSPSVYQFDMRIDARDSFRRENASQADWRSLQHLQPFERGAGEQYVLQLLRRDGGHAYCAVSSYGFRDAAQLCIAGVGHDDLCVSAPDPTGD